nr:hypothetical protein [Tanacetum cinerariifolium]
MRHVHRHISKTPSPYLEYVQEK